MACAGLLEVSNSGSGYLFAYFLVGHAGYRLALKPALAVAALSSLLCGAVFYFYVGPDHQVLTWTFGLSTGVPVVAGILGRSKQQAVEARLQAAESAERAARAEAQTAVLTERGRIARDVHDVLAHSLAGINMHLELADALIDTGDLEKVRAAHNRAQSLVRESLKQAQWTVHALREDSLPLLVRPPRGAHRHRGRPGAVGTGHPERAAHRAGGADQRGPARSWGRDRGGAGLRRRLDQACRPQRACDR
nr:hypothetical protein StreXyl84_65210 [Streptomyces sp. Xyl84]